MNFANYTYYSEAYGGSLLSEEQFNYYAGRASEYINQQTFDRISVAVPEALTTKVSACCCELAENLYRFSSTSSGSGNSGAGCNVSSEKVGQYSITYHSTAESISGKLNGSEAGLLDLLYNVICKHLASTGLLYRGVE